MYTGLCSYSPLPPRKKSFSRAYTWEWNCWGEKVCLFSILLDIVKFFSKDMPIYNSISYLWVFIGPYFCQHLGLSDFKFICEFDEYKMVLNGGFNLPFPDYWLGETCFHLFISQSFYFLFDLSLYPLAIFLLNLFFLFFRILGKFWFHLLVAVFAVFSSGLWLVFSCQVVFCCILVLLFKYSQ